MTPADIPLIDSRVKELEIDPETVPDFSLGISNVDIEKLKLPLEVGLSLHIKEHTKLRVDFCGYYNGMYILDIPIRRHDSPLVAHLKFASMLKPAFSQAFSCI